MAAACIQQQPRPILVSYVQLVGLITDTESCHNSCCEYAAAETDAAATAASCGLCYHAAT